MIGEIYLPSLLNIYNFWNYGSTELNTRSKKDFTKLNMPGFFLAPFGFVESMLEEKFRAMPFFSNLENSKKHCEMFGR